MIEVSGETDGRQGRAWYSPCETYRYGLERRWGAGGTVLFVMLNPSTADALRNDPTIERCERRARAMGFGVLRVANLFAYRATRPEDLRRAPEPVGPGTDALLDTWSAAADLVVAGWGVHGGHDGRAQAVAARLPAATTHLGLTMAGHPRHPLYVSYAVGPTPWPHVERYR